jgi:hypothetical protein
MPLKIRLSEHHLSLTQLHDIHFKLMDQQCPVHFQSPVSEIVDGEIEYSCCCEELKKLCMLVLITGKNRMD